ncbi:MAG TPA: hypothetical protein VL175_10125 [Pirellulales bacterium]|jgi:hypothetical protein|nr:hypothetical protein [Pirellulales bacterium]
MSDAIVRVIFLPLYPFVTHPERITVVAALFLLGFLALLWTGRFRTPWPMLAAAIAWGLWVPWEQNCNAMKYNIRVDLLLLYPLLFGVTLWALLAPFRALSHGAK